MPGYVYIVRFGPTAVTAAKTLVQIKTGVNNGIEVLSAKISQVTKTSSELLRVGVLRKTAAATVTAFTPLELSTQDPASAVNVSTSGTGVDASAEGSDSDILEEDHWNVLNGSWLYLPVPEERIWVPNGSFIALKLFTAPAASMTIAGWIRYREYQG